MTRLEKLLVDTENMVREFKLKFIDSYNKLTEEEKQVYFDHARKIGDDEEEFYNDSGVLLSDIGFNDTIDMRLFDIAGLKSTIESIDID